MDLNHALSISDNLYTSTPLFLPSNTEALFVMDKWANEAISTVEGIYIDHGHWRFPFQLRGWFAIKDLL